MKIFKLFPLFALAVAAAACQPEDDPQNGAPVSFSLSENNIELSGLEQPSLVSVDNNAQTVDIYVDYADKDNIKALQLDFVNLEEGVEVQYEQVYNYAQGPQTVVFVKEETEFSYVVSVEVGEPSVKFISLTVAGQSALGGEVKMSSAVDLTALQVEFEVSPEGSKVFVGGGTEISSGDLIDFSDKLNGVTFVARCGASEQSLNVKVVTTGINSVKRVWGRYYKPFSEGEDATWFGTKVTGEANVLRTVAMTDEYVFLSKDKDSENALGGVYAIRISDPDDVKLLSQESFAEGTRVFGITALENTVLVSTFSAAAGSVFRIYAYDDITAAPRCLIEYTLPEAMRLGDRITAEGNWEKGRIFVYDSTSGNKVLSFSVRSNLVNKNPQIIDLDIKLGNYAAFYPYKDNQYIGGAGTGTHLFTLDGTLATKQFTFDTAIIAAPTLGIRFFECNGEQYMAYVVLRNAYQDGQFRISPLSGETLEESINAISKSYAFYLGDPNATEDGIYNKNANASGEGYLRQIGDKWYYAAFVTGTGLSLFEIQ
ncbi:MAG: hypothetical protein ACI3ZF_05220 [Candidatus Cryptobacteroides sp.]